MRVEARRDDGDRLQLILPGEAEPVAPTHWSFGQLAGLVGAPAGYLRQLPAAVAGINLQYGLSHHRAEMIKAYTTETGRTELRAATGPDYGRIHDFELVDAVMRIAGNGTGDTRWKVPGVLDWRTMTYDPHGLDPKVWPSEALALQLQASRSTKSGRFSMVWLKLYRSKNRSGARSNQY